MEKERIAKLVPPHRDKNHSFQVIFIKEGDKERILSLFSDPVVKPTQPFLQGATREWLMVEFWTKDITLIKRATDKLTATLNVSYTEGDFTREELGL